MSLVDTIKKDAKTAKWIGIALIAGGFLSLVSPLAAGMSVTLIIGVLLLFSGITQLFLVFSTGSFGKGVLLALIGILTVVAGGYSVTQPLAALAGLTVFLAAYFVATGIVEIFGALGARPQAGWGWLLFSGATSLLLGFMIWQQFPLSGAWAIGSLVGVRMLISGWTLVAVGGTVSSATAEVGS